jgi:hypothetical protein
MKSNAYNFSNDLARIGSALSRAMIGNASDDAAIALAQYRDAQTEGQNQENTFRKGQFDAIDTASAPTGMLSQSMLNSQGVGLDGNNNFVKLQPPGARPQTIPAYANQNTMTQADMLAQAGAMARALFGDGKYSPNQLTEALGDLSANRDSNMARSMILDPATAEKMLRRAGIVLNQDQYVNMDNNTADNIAAGERNAADNIASGERNAADNIASGERNAADNIASGERNAADNIASGERNAADNNKPGADTRKRPSVKDSNANWTAVTDTVAGYDNLPPAVKGKLRVRLLKAVDQGLKNDQQASYDAVYAQAVIDPLLSGMTDITPSGLGNDFVFPSFIYNNLKNKLFAPNALGELPNNLPAPTEADPSRVLPRREWTIEVAKELGYSDKQAQQVADQVLAP